MWGCFWGAGEDDLNILLLGGCFSPLCVKDWGFCLKNNRCSFLSTRTSLVDFASFARSFSPFLFLWMNGLFSVDVLESLELCGYF